MQKQGSSLFKVASILLLIWGVIAVIVNGVQFVDIAPYLSMLGGSILFGMCLLLLSTVVMAVAGLMGVINSKKPEKAGMCQTIGIVALAMILLGTILLLAGIGSEAVNWIFTFIGVILTSLYIVGAKQLKNTPVEQPMNYGYNAGGFNPNNPYNNPGNPYGAPNNPYANPTYQDPNSNNQNDQQ